MWPQGCEQRARGVSYPAKVPTESCGSCTRRNHGPSFMVPEIDQIEAAKALGPLCSRAPMKVIV